MARPTDVERGARIALEVAHGKLMQHPLFPEPLGEEFWRSVRAAAADQLVECDAFRAAQS